MEYIICLNSYSMCHVLTPFTIIYSLALDDNPTIHKKLSYWSIFSFDKMKFTF